MPPASPRKPPRRRPRRRTADMAAPDMSGGPAGRRLPATADRPWPAWVLAAVAATVGGAAVLGGVQMIRDGFGMPREWLWLWQRTEGRRSDHTRDVRP